MVVKSSPEKQKLLGILTITTIITKFKLRNNNCNIPWRAKEMNGKQFIEMSKLQPTHLESAIYRIKFKYSYMSNHAYINIRFIRTREREKKEEKHSPERID